MIDIKNAWVYEGVIYLKNSHKTTCPYNITQPGFSANLDLRFLYISPISPSLPFIRSDHVKD